MKESEIRARVEGLLRRVIVPAGIIAFAACAYGAPFDDRDAAVVPDASAEQSTGDAADATADGDPDTRG